MPLRDTNGRSSIFVPILLIVFAAAISLAFVREQFAIAKLHKTDKIACQFINADATTRRKQASNSGLTLNRVMIHVVRTRQVIGLERLAKNPTAGTRLFFNYLRSEEDVWSSYQRSLSANLILTRNLAASAIGLAQQLNC